MPRNRKQAPGRKKTVAVGNPMKFKRKRHQEYQMEIARLENQLARAAASYRHADFVKILLARLAEMAEKFLAREYPFDERPVQNPARFVEELIDALTCDLESRRTGVQWKLESSRLNVKP